ncbi:hypothetical protein KIL84_015322 [Mauremys mutica]|uniref:Uncharacterized protein n=1 Tax=Mauremys mutica TaxID=74926 RepID=A0A9D3WSY1_9SAUR|nr:hypothetical protein KIL84_015322 [Mauremys mutica]
MCEILATFKLFRGGEEHPPTLLLKACETIIQHQQNVEEKMETKEKFQAQAAFLQKVRRAETAGPASSALTTALLHNLHLPVHSLFLSCRWLFNRPCCFWGEWE